MSNQQDIQSCCLHEQEVEPGIYSVCFGDSRLLEGRASGSMQRHAWADPLLDNLAAYQRPSSLIAPQPDVKDEDRALAFERAADQVPTHPPSMSASSCASMIYISVIFALKQPEHNLW